MTPRVLFLTLVLGCGGQEESDGGGSLPIGRACDPGDCAEGLECLTQLTADEAGVPWCEGESFCSMSCTDDPECTDALGDGHICVQDGCSDGGMCFEGSSG